MNYIIKVSTLFWLVIYFTFFFVIVNNGSNAQGVSINANGTPPDSSSILDVNSNSKGLLIPRIGLISNTDVLTIPSPTVSLMVFNTGTGGLMPSGFYYWDGSHWLPFGFSNKIAINTTQVNTGSSTFVPLYSVIIPGGTLEFNNALKFSVIVSSLDLGGNENIRIKVLYGGYELVPEIRYTQSNVSGNDPALLEGLIIADNSINSQKGELKIFKRNLNGTPEIIIGYGSSTINSAIDQPLVIQVRFQSSNCSITAEGICVEVIK